MEVLGYVFGDGVMSMFCKSVLPGNSSYGGGAIFPNFAVSMSERGVLYPAAISYDTTAKSVFPIENVYNHFPDGREVIDALSEILRGVPRATERAKIQITPHGYCRKIQARIGRHSISVENYVGKYSDLTWDTWKESGYMRRTCEIPAAVCASLVDALKREMTA